METTNFSHIKMHSDIYDKLVLDEKKLIDAYDKVNPNKTELLSVMSEMRKSMELIIRYMIKKANLSDDKVMSLFHKVKPGDTATRPSLYINIVALGQIGAFNSEFEQKIHSKIRKPGNDAVHYYDESDNNSLLNASATQVLRKAEEMYETLYELSYVVVKSFDVEYMNSSKKSKPEENVKAMLDVANISKPNVGYKLSFKSFLYAIGFIVMFSIFIFIFMEMFL